MREVFLKVYIYKTVAAPTGIAVKHQNDTNAAVSAFSNVINRECVDGWEFYSIESIAVSSNPGCFGMLFRGAREKNVTLNMLVFRKLQ